MSIDIEAIRQRHAIGHNGTGDDAALLAHEDRAALLAEVDRLTEALTEVLLGISWRDRDIWGRVVGSGMVWIELSEDADRVVRDVLGIPNDEARQ